MEAGKPRTLSEIGAAAGEGAGVIPAESIEVTALVVRAKAGDADAFADLMRLYQRRIISVAVQMGLSRDDAHDACQESFVKVFKYIHRFETGRSFFKWLYRIAVNVIYDQLSRLRSTPTMSIEDLDVGHRSLVQSEGTGLHQNLEAAQLAARVRECLDLLSRRERIVFVLRDLQELSTEEIGIILGLSQITVRRHCMSARHKLKKQIFPRRP